MIGMPLTKRLHLKRYRQIIRVLVRHGFGLLLDKVRAKKIDDDTKAELLRVIGDFKQQFMAKHHSDVSVSEES